MIQETQVNIISEGSRLEGKINLESACRIHGTIRGEVNGAPGSTLVFGETALIEGSVNGDTVIIDGFIQGDIVASTRVVISGTGRVIGNIRAASLSIEFGAHFEGRTEMPKASAAAATREAPSAPPA